MCVGVLKAMHCPFLTRIPLGQVRQHATELLQMADRCPIMGHVMKYSAMTTSEGVTPSRGQYLGRVGSIFGSGWEFV